MQIDFTLVIEAYKKGMFPMAEDANSREVLWIEPKNRGIIELNEFKVPKSLKKTLKKRTFKIKVNTKFEQVIEACAKAVPGRELTWINTAIKTTYITLYEQGYAHCIECYKDENLVGGLYGVAIGGMFFGESMFSFEKDASKVALVHLVDRLIFGNFLIIDTQFITNHLRNFGAKEVTQENFLIFLDRALPVQGDFLKYSPAGILKTELYP